MSLDSFLVRPNCAQTVYDQIRVRSNALPMRPSCARIPYDKTQVRSNTPLIRPTPDHGPDCSALEIPSRPCNFGLRTHKCALDWV